MENDELKNNINSEDEIISPETNEIIFADDNLNNDSNARYTVYIKANPDGGGSTTTKYLVPSGYTFATSNANKKIIIYDDSGDEWWSYTVTANSGYTFNCWSKSSGSISAATTIYALYDSTISYNANGHGTAPASQTKEYDEDLTLRAFIGKVSSTSTGATLKFNVNGGESTAPGDIEVEKVITYTQQYWNTKSSGKGTNYSSKGTYTAEGNATLYAIWNSGSTSWNSVTMPAAATRTGYTFQYWNTSSDGTGTNFSASTSYDPDTYTALKSDRTLYATWKINQYTITPVADANSTVSGGGTYDYGTEVTITATANTGYKFVAWYKNGTKTSTTNPLKLTANSSNAGTYQVSTAKNTYTISLKASPSGYGTLTANDGTTSFTAEYDDVITNSNGIIYKNSSKAATESPASTTAQYTYAFSYWTNGSFTVDGAKTITANFTRTLRSYVITPSVYSGSGTATVDKTSYTYGSTCKATATADTGYSFTKWVTETGSQLSTNNPYTFTVTGAKTIFAVFTAHTYTVTYGANGGSGSMASTSHTYGTESKLRENTFTKTGHDFAYWNVSGTTSTLSDQADMTYYDATGTVALTAKWDPWECTITLKKSGSGVGTIYYKIESGKWIEYSSSFTAEYGDTISVYSEDVTGYNQTYTKTSPGSFTVLNKTTSFSLTASIKTFVISFTPNPTAGGTIKDDTTSESVSTYTFNYGTTYTYSDNKVSFYFSNSLVKCVKAVVNTGYYFKTWTDNQPTSGTITQTGAFYANFKAYYTIKYVSESTTKGTVTGNTTSYIGEDTPEVTLSGNSISVTRGSNTYTCTAVPSELTKTTPKCTFDGWYTSSGTKLTTGSKLTSSQTITAKFKYYQYDTFNWTSDDDTYIQKGQSCSQITAKKWNLLGEYITHYRLVHGLSYLTFTEVSAGDTITAALFNAYRNSLQAIFEATTAYSDYTMVDKVTADTTYILASQFYTSDTTKTTDVALKNAINLIIDLPV